MKKRILHITNKPIYPMVDGGCVAMHQFAQSLFSLPDTEVFHLCISTAKHPFSNKGYERNQSDYNVFDHVPVDTSIQIIDGIKTILKGKSYNLSRFNDQTLVDKINSWIIQYRIDTLLFDSLFAAAILENNTFNLPTYIRAHNIESDLW